MTTPQMRIAVAGAGAMGCRFGWMLDRAGAEVTLLDGWSHHRDAINADGLRVRDERGEHVVALTARPLSGCDRPNLVIVFGKAMETASILAACAPGLATHTRVMTLQNGLGNVEVLERWVMRGRILVGTTTFTAELMGPGRVRATGGGTTQVMTLDRGAAAGNADVIDVMAAAGLNVQVTDDVMATVWTKLAFNCVLNALCALLRVPVGALPRYSGLSEVTREIVVEVVAVAASQGTRIDLDAIVATIESQYEAGAGRDHLPSMLVDALQGRETEVAHLNGGVARLGAEAGIDVPCNRLIAALLEMMHATGDARIESLASLHEPASH